MKFPNPLWDCDYDLMWNKIGENNPLIMSNLSVRASKNAYKSISLYIQRTLQLNKNFHHQIPLVSLMVF